jgi:hypothetical protein
MGDRTIVAGGVLLLAQVWLGVVALGDGWAAHAGTVALAALLAAAAALRAAAARRRAA